MAIDAILLDADGVVQTMHPEFHASVAATLGRAEPIDELLDEIFVAERASLTGQRGFREVLQALLREHGIAAPVDEVLRHWCQIEPVPGVLDVVADLRAREYPCFVASNQQRHRARHMSVNLRYAELFTGEFYSCALGATKPDPAFFEAILRELDLEPSSLLFLDDHQPNVDAACAQGIVGVRFDARHHPDPAAALRAVIEEKLALK